MVAQFFFLVVLFVVGLTCLAAVRGRVGITLSCLLAFPLGSAVWVLLSVVVLVTGLPYRAPVMNVGLLVVALIGIVLTLRAGIPKTRELLAAGAATVVLAAAAALAVSHNYTFCSDDSWQLILLGKGLGTYGALASPVVHWVYSYGILLPALHAAAAIYGFDYLYAHTPVLSLCLVGAFASLTFDALRRCRLSTRLAVGGAVLGSMLLAANYFYVFQSFFLLANLTTGVYLFLGVALLCRYLQDLEIEWLVLGSLFVCCFAIARVETPFLALLVWVALLSYPQVRPGPLGWSYGGYTLVVATWFLAAVSAGGWHYSYFLSARVVVGIMLTLAVVWVGIVVRATPLRRVRGVSWLVQRLPDFALYTLAAGMLLLVATRPGHASTSICNMLLNAFTGYGRWGVTWLTVVVLALLAGWLRPWHSHRLLVTVIVGSLLMIYTASFFRSPYRLGWGDSGNRMLLHVFPVICFYLVTRCGCSLRPQESGATSVE